MSSDMTRSEALKELKEYTEGLDMEYATPFDKAILFAIASLETDEAYNLMYEQPEFVADCISRKDSGIRIAKNEYLRGWHDAICSALKEKYHIHCDEGDFTVVQEETLIGLGMSKDSPISKSAEDFINIMPSVLPKLYVPDNNVGESEDCIDRMDTINTVKELYLDLATQKAVIDILKIMPSVYSKSDNSVLEDIKINLIK